MTGTERIEVKKIYVGSAGKFGLLWGIVIGLIFGVFFFLTIMFGASDVQVGNLDSSGGGIVIALVFFFVFLIGIVIASFIASVIGAVLYNFIAKMGGMIEVGLGESEKN